MKTLKQIILEEDEKSKSFFKSTGTPGKGNWSLGGADLAKQWADDPKFKHKLTAPDDETDALRLVKRVGGSLGPEAFRGMSDADMDLVVRHINQIMDASIWQARNRKEKSTQVARPVGKVPNVK